MMNPGLVCRNGRPIANEGQTLFSWLLGPEVPPEPPFPVSESAWLSGSLQNNSSSSYRHQGPSSCLGPEWTERVLNSGTPNTEA